MLARMELSPRSSRDASPTTSGDASRPCRGDASRPSTSDASPVAGVDASPAAAATRGGACAWCSRPIPGRARRDSIFCGKRCRQTAHRVRRLGTRIERMSKPMRFAYADPPYPGKAKRYYGGEPTYAGEVDHPELIARLERRRAEGELDGWALSTSEKALRTVLPLCPPATRVCPWCHLGGAAPGTNGIHASSEFVLVVGGRQRPPGVRNWLLAHAARRGGTLKGRKPIKFSSWLFDLLGAEPGDELEDLFPGTGGVSRAWRERQRAVAARGRDASRGGQTDREAPRAVHADERSLPAE
jgi:hypothetical protein